MANNATKSNKKLFKAYFKKKNENSLFSIIWVPFREAGMFLLPLPLLYLLFYYLVFEDGGRLSGKRTLYVIILISFLVADIAAYLLRIVWRNYKFRKYSDYDVPLHKKNRWVCPHCHSENNLLSPCPKCGIFPNLCKTDDEKLNAAKPGRRRKEQKQFDEYVPQFK